MVEQKSSKRGCSSKSPAKTLSEEDRACAWSSLEILKHYRIDGESLQRLAVDYYAPPPNAFDSELLQNSKSLCSSKFTMRSVLVEKGPLGKHVGGTPLCGTPFAMISKEARLIWRAPIYFILRRVCSFNQQGLTLGSLQWDLLRQSSANADQLRQAISPIPNRQHSASEIKLASHFASPHGVSLATASANRAIQI